MKQKLDLKLKNGGIPFDPYDTNTYQIITYGIHKNQSKRANMTYQKNFDLKVIRSQMLQNKIIRNYQYLFDFTLSKIQILIHQQKQNKMSKLSLTLIFKNVFYLLVSIVFAVITELGGIVSKS